MTARQPSGPGLAARLLERAIGRSAWTDSILGDLHEEHARLASAGRSFAARRADLWYWHQAIRLALRYTARHFAPRSTLPALPESQGDSLMQILTLEIRYAVRALLKTPGMTALVVLTLALGLGANASIFAMIDTLILRPYTIPNLDRIAMVGETVPGEDYGARESVAPANFVDWKQQADTFDHLSAFSWWDVNLAGADEPERVSGFNVSADFFAALGIEAALGRTFTADEEIHGQHRKALLSHGLWQRRFGGDSGVVGRTVLLDTQQYEIVGVAPAGFDFPLGAEIWAPLSFDAHTAAMRTRRYLTVVGRLRPGRSLDDAKAQMAVVARRLEQQYPEANRDHGAEVSTLVQGMRDQGIGPIMALCQASAFFVLLIACANIANLLLARGAERHRDLAVRSAMGASRGRLVRELLIEGGVMAIASIPAALAVAWVGIRLIRVNMPARIIRFVPGWDRLDVDANIVTFTAALAAATVVIFGILPALKASRPQLADALKDGGRSQTAGRNRQRLRRGLVVAEIALSIPLLVASGLGIIGTNRFLNGPQGYDPDGLLTMKAVLPDGRYAEPAARRQFTAAVVERLSQLPGVQLASVVNNIPSSSSNNGRTIQVEGGPLPDEAHPTTVDYRAMRPEYFDTMRIPLVRGRGFNTADREDAAPVAIVSESLVERHLPGSDGLGKRIKLGTGDWVTIVGVSRDVIHDWFDHRRYPTAYRPYAQAPSPGVVFVLRTAGDPEALTLAAARAVRAVDPSQPVFDVMTMRRVLSEKTIGLQYVAVIMAVFGGLALVLAVVGVYSLMAFLVAQRTHEIGVRIALGATRRDVMRLSVGQTARLTGIGALLGLVFATALGRLMEAGLLGIIASDARISIAFAAVLTAAALAAGYIPARRATTIDPIVALRSE